MADIVGGNIIWNLDVNAKKFKSGLEVAEKKAASSAKKIDSNIFGMSKSVNLSFKNATNASNQFAIGLGAIATSLLGATGIGLKTASEFETLTTALETVTGSSDAAVQAMETIKQVAKESPFFEVGTLAEFTQKMVAAGQSIDEAVDSGIGFGDVAAAFGKGNAELERLGNTLTQVIGKGKADSVDFKELVNSGWVSVRKDTAEAMGVTIAQFEDMVSAGEVGYQQISKAASKFTGSAEKQSTNLSSLWSRLKETVETTFADIVINTGIFDQVKVAISGIIVALESIDQEAIDSFISAFTQNIPIITGLIIGGLTPVLSAMFTAIVASVSALAPFIIIGGAIGLIVQQLVQAFGGWRSVFEQLSSIYTQQIQPALQGLFNALQNELVPAVKDLWSKIGPILIPKLKLLARISAGILLASIKLLISIITKIITLVSYAIRKFTDLVNFFTSIPGKIQSAFSGLTSILTKPFEDAYIKIKDVAGKIKDAASRISPFHRESPSLVDRVTSGVQEIKDQYSSLGSLSIPSAASPSFAAIGVGGTGEAGQTNNTMSQNINIEIGQVNEQSDVEMISREIAFRSGVLPI